MPPTLEIMQRMADLRSKCRDGTATLEEMREGISFLRQERLAMPPAKASGSRKVVIDADSLLGELGI